MIARYQGICGWCGDTIHPRTEIGQHPIEGKITWCHAKCIPSEVTIGWNGTPSGRTTTWRRKPPRRLGPSR